MKLKIKRERRFIMSKDLLQHQIETAKSIIQQKGGCAGLDCHNCPARGAAFKCDPDPTSVNPEMEKFAEEWLEKNENLEAQLNTPEEAENKEKKINVALKIIEQDGICSGVSCFDCPAYIKERCSELDFDKADNGIVDFMKSWLKLNAPELDIKNKIPEGDCVGIERPEMMSPEHRSLCIKNAERIIEQKGICTGVNCLDCPAMRDSVSKGCVSATVPSAVDASLVKSMENWLSEQDQVGTQPIEEAPEAKAEEFAHVDDLIEPPSLFARTWASLKWLFTKAGPDPVCQEVYFFESEEIKILYVLLDVHSNAPTLVNKYRLWDYVEMVSQFDLARERILGLNLDNIRAPYAHVKERE